MSETAQNIILFILNDTFGLSYLKKKLRNQ